MDCYSTSEQSEYVRNIPEFNSKMMHRNIRKSVQ
ncbi:unnamed protein product [Brugia timori]|uniref:Uncharacterized protein n=1 Tax=Brugia timori TaxID=42155 RepID=A0A3P7UU68_9BILA|nr:unnamed protein product [Brugia timori]